MAPDLNSLPSSKPLSVPPSPRSPLQQPRRISVSSADVHNTRNHPHRRQPSLGELHQELENEQEAQVNRLLHLIRLQQDQLAAIQRSPHDPSQAPSSPPLHTSPTLSGTTTDHPADDLFSAASRDESAFYRAETQMLTRENQMLRLRIRELERQVAEIGSSTTAGAHSLVHSPLTSPPPLAAEAETAKVE